jgi:hypothetical protein
LYYGDPAGYWEASFEVTGGRPYGVSNFAARFELPFPVRPPMVVTDGGCKAFRVVENRTTRISGDRAIDNALDGVILADSCPSGARPIIRFEPVPEPAEHLRADLGRCAIDFDWRPLFSPWWELPWTRIFGTKTWAIPGRPQGLAVEGEHPSSISVSLPPYYVDGGKRGVVAAYLRTEDFQKLLDRGGTVFRIDEPSTRVEVFASADGELGYRLRTLSCPGGVTEQHVVRGRMPLSEMGVVESRLSLEWEGCKGQLFVLGFNCNLMPEGSILEASGG